MIGDKSGCLPNNQKYGLVEATKDDFDTMLENINHNSDTMLKKRRQLSYHHKVHGENIKKKIKEGKDRKKNKKR